MAVIQRAVTGKHKSNLNAKLQIFSSKRSKSLTQISSQNGTEALQNRRDHNHPPCSLDAADTTINLLIMGC